MLKNSSSRIDCTSHTVPSQDLISHALWLCKNLHHHCHPPSAMGIFASSTSSSSPFSSSGASRIFLLFPRCNTVLVSN